MQDYKKVQVTHRIILVCMFVICLVFHKSFARGQKKLPIEDVKAMIKTVIPALEALERQLPVKGRGIATMKTENYLRGFFDGKELTVDFVFKGHNSRWDVFETISGSKSSRLRARLTTDKHCTSLVSDDSVTINPAKNHTAHRNDFHPETFMRFLGHPLTRWLQGTLEYDFSADPEQYASATIDDNGILHIVSGGPVGSPKSEILSSEYQMSLDTKRGLIPVFLRNTTKTSETTNSSTVRLDWIKHGSVWYVSYIEYNEEPGNRLHRIFKIKNFTTNVEVSDDEFTLKGLNIPDGMLVVDRLAGITYRYGITNDPVEELEKALEKAEFVRKIKAKKQAPLNQKDNTNIGQQITEPNQIQVDGYVEPKGINDAHADLFLRRGIVIAGIVVFIGIVAFFGYRYFVT